jgi:hypothetical protein
MLACFPEPRTLARRLNRKTPPPPPPPDRSDPIVVEMLAADGLVALPGDARRQCVHYTHCRNRVRGAVQPGQISRKRVFEIIRLCYVEAYPDAESPTHCILKFGLAAKEKHKDALVEADRSEHHHIIVFCTINHYWRKIRTIAAAKYNLHLNAVAHDGYASMYRYLRNASKKKPQHELDQEPWFSPRHPKGDELKELLENGEKTRAARAARAPPPTSPAESTGTDVRSVFGFAFNWVVDRKLRGSQGAMQLQADAAKAIDCFPRTCVFLPCPSWCGPNVRRSCPLVLVSRPE